MTLTGTRTEWEALVRRNDEGIGLKDDHVDRIRTALDETPADVDVVDVDATLAATRQVIERTPTARRDDRRVPVRSLAAEIADDDECWWLHRSRELGLTSIVPIEPWPRRPETYIRPPGYLHRYGPEPPAWYVASIDQLKAVQEERRRDEN